MRIAIIGGGVMGCATARALAQRGAKVMLLERAVPGAEASSAAAGILGAQAESHAPGPLHDLLVRARRGYEAWAGELRAETGIDVGYRASGLLSIASDHDGHARLVRDVTWQTNAGLRAELMNGADAHLIEPELSPEVKTAAYFPDDAQVDPPMLLRALTASLVRAKVNVRSGATVACLLVEREKCVGIALDDGTEVRADATVLAAGSWSSLIPGTAGIFPTVRPARGQMIELDERPPRVRTIVFAERGYVVPRGDGRVLCGSTVEFVGFRREVTARGNPRDPRRCSRERALACRGPARANVVELPPPRRQHRAAHRREHHARPLPRHRTPPQRDPPREGHRRQSRRRRSVMTRVG
jgi:glycine oxidase